MTNISKRDFLKTIPATIPAAMVGGLAGGMILPASAHDNFSINNITRQIGDFVFDATSIVFSVTEESMSSVNKAYKNISEVYEVIKSNAITELCNEPMKILKDGFDVNISKEQCTEIVKPLVGTFEELVVFLFFGKYRWLVIPVGNSYSIFLMAAKLQQR